VLTLIIILSQRSVLVKKKLLSIVYQCDTAKLIIILYWFHQ